MPEDEGKPVKKGDVIEVKIISEGKRGDGVAKYQGFIVFVPGGKIDEIVQVRIIDVRQKFAIGERVE